jgi:alkanesulfonate monooxygenase SsuD/methylene tetrahydromethanopterin reductase-like flavin-dependent oxidoreductase (luciferase family)
VTTGVLVGSWPLGMPGEPAQFYPRLARLVEDAGFDSLFVGDHLFAAGPSVDALALLADISARTSRIDVGTAVLQLALREPVATAKQIATIDMLSRGRVVLGVGVGGEFADEWAAAGVPTAGRGARLDEWLDLAHRLWSGEPVEHRGTLRTVDAVRGSPLPHSAGGPRVWVGGRSDAALCRAARYDGWVAYAVSLRRLRESLSRLRELRGAGTELRIALVLWTNVARSEDAARESIATVLGTRYRQDFDGFVDAFCAIGEPRAVAERIQAFREAGVTDVLLCPQCPAEEFLGQVEMLAELEGQR